MINLITEISKQINNIGQIYVLSNMHCITSRLLKSHMINVSTPLGFKITFHNEKLSKVAMTTSAVLNFVSHILDFLLDMYTF